MNNIPYIGHRTYNHTYIGFYTILIFVIPNEQWYDKIIDPPSLEEWLQIVQHLANGKAPEPSEVSNEMIKHVGFKMSKAIWQLVCLCCIYQDIPKGWRE